MVSVRREQKIFYWFIFVHHNNKSMKKSNSFLIGLFYVLGVIQGSGQSSNPNVPKMFTYQSVVRDSLGQLIINHNLRMRLSLRRAPHMTNLYIETHQLTTNSNGLLTCSIGSGQPFWGMMDTIDWSLGNVNIQTEVDLTGGNNFINLGNQELLSVPYALYSLSSGSSTPGPQGPMGPPGPQGSFPSGTQPGEMNYWNGTTWVMVPPGNHGQFLAFCDGVPQWGGCLPQVNTSPVLNISSTGATTGGNVISNGNSLVTSRGVVYSTMVNPTLSNSFTNINAGTGLGIFTSTLTGLIASTRYYVRAYATNSLGTAYGSQLSFNTWSLAPCPGTPTVFDIDGNAYNTVQIGTQCWTQSNLKVSKYRNGDNIITGLSNNDWVNATYGAYAIYNNDPVNDSLFGKVYNNYTTTDSRGICPTGWHVPSDIEWSTLDNYLGGSAVSGGALKDTLLEPIARGWRPPNIGATNSSGFTAFPGGIRNFNGDYYNNSLGIWWTSTRMVNSAWCRFMYNYTNQNNRATAAIIEGFSIRCLKD